jgi:putative ABC transport system permease protein
MNNENKSIFALRFLRWFCPASLYESIEGDLLEQFEKDLKPSDRFEPACPVGRRSDGYWQRRARRKLFWNVITFFRPGILLRNKNSMNLNQLMISIHMVGNYIKIALRTIGRHKTISFINIAGLAVCMSVCLLIMMLISTHMSYDRFHPHPERTYRIIEKYYQSEFGGWSPLPLSNELGSYPFVESSVSIWQSERQLALSGKLDIPLSVAFTENSFFKVFGFELKSGDKATALSEPYSVILTEEASKKIFGTVDPLGKTLEMKNWEGFTVTGVLKHTEQNSRIYSEIFISRATLSPLILSHKLALDIDSWSRNYFSNTFVLLKNVNDRPFLQQTLNQISEKNKPKVDGQELKSNFTTLALNEIPPPIDSMSQGIPVGMTTVDMAAFSGFGLVFILLAVFNYTNLTVARSFARAKEVGVRKITGALRIQIATQIFVESVLIAVFAMCISIFIARFFPISPGLEESIDFKTFDTTLFLYALCFAVVVGLMAGLFPAIILSRIKPLQAIGKILNTRLFKSLKARNALIVVQFCLSLIFMIIVVVMYRQMQFEVTGDYGFDRSNILTVPVHNTDYKLLQTEIERHTGIIRASASLESPHGNGKPARVFIGEKKDSIDIYYKSIDSQFLSTWGIPLIAGRNLPERTAQTQEQFVLLNESAMRKLDLGSPQDAIGKSIHVDSIDLQIVGIVKDFHSDGFRWVISPLLFRYRPEEFNQISIKYQPGSVEIAEAHVNAIWKKFEPDYPMMPVRYGETFDEQKAHTKDIAMIGTFSMIAIFVSCLGLFGVVLYSMEIRTKEIAIRKIMGAPVLQLTAVLSKSFFLLLFIAFVIALPIGYFVGRQMLNMYVYKIELGVELALTIFAITTGIGLIIICSQTIRAALGNPIAAMKND